MSVANLDSYHGVALSLTQDLVNWLQPTGEFGYRAPLYSIYLAAFYSLADPMKYPVGQLANLLLFLVTATLLWKLLSVRFGTRVAVVGLAIRTLAPPFVVEDLLLLSEPLFQVFVLSGTLLLMSRRSSSQAAGLGAVLAAGVLTREYAQGLILVIIGIFLFIDLHGRCFHWNWWCPFITSVILVLSPWLMRNTIVFGSPFPLATSSGVNIHIGNQPGATGTWSVFYDQEHNSPEALAFGSRATDRWHREKALAYVMEHPTHFLKLAGWKLGYLVWPRTLKEELLDEPLWLSMPRWAAVTLVLSNMATFGLLWVAGLAGLIASRDIRYVAVVVTFVAYTASVTVISFGSPRFADPILLLLIGPAACFLTSPRAVLHACSSTDRRWLLASSLVAIAGLWALISYQKVAAKVEPGKAFARSDLPAVSGPLES